MKIKRKEKNIMHSSEPKNSYTKCVRNINIHPEMWFRAPSIMFIISQKSYYYCVEKKEYERQKYKNKNKK